MADPFHRRKAAKPAETKSTSAQFLPAGAMGRPIQKDWSLDGAIVSGFRACGWVYACAMVIAEHIAKMPWGVWEKNSSGNYVVVPGHDLEFLIEHPNEHQTRDEQMTYRGLHLCLCGNFLDRIVTVAGRADELWTMYPDSVRPIPSAETWLSHYEVRDNVHGPPKRMEPAEVVHGKLVDPKNPFWGYPVIRSVAPVVDMDVSQVTWNRELINNSAMPRGAFVDPNIVSPKDRAQVKEAIREQFGGPMRAGETIVLSGGAKWERIGLGPQELDWIASRTFSVGEICASFGLLPQRFLMDASTYNNLKTAVRYELVNGALPKARKIGDALGMRLLTRDERRRGMKIRPDTSKVEELQSDVHQAAESMERLVRSTVPPAVAASLVNLPVGDLPAGDRTYKDVRLEEVLFGGSDLTESDI